MRRNVWLLSGLAGVACGPDRDGLLPGPLGASIQLTLDSMPQPAEGAGRVRQVDGTAGVDCIAGTSLTFDSMEGIYLTSVSVADQVPGTRSEMVNGAFIQFNPTDITAPVSDAKRLWTGTLEVVSWSPERVELNLTAGTDCDTSTEPAVCVPATGTLTFDGAWTSTASAGIGGWVQYKDVATGESVCPPLTDNDT